MWKPEIDALLNTITDATITRDEFRDRLHTLLHAAVEQERRRCTQIVENEISAYRMAAAFGVDDIDVTLSAIAARIAGEEAK